MSNYFFSLTRRIKRKIQSIVVPSLLEWKVTLDFLRRCKAKPHGLASPLIVSLTSYPARFGKLHFTLKCLLSQSMSADRVILWIAHQDKQFLTQEILGLQKTGLEIAYCDDLRSYKKIIPTLQTYPDSFIVTADDDLYYWPKWLEELVISYQKHGKDVIYHRGHHIKLDYDGLPLPYSQWEFDARRVDASSLNFQTGVGGVLYPPRAFHPDVLNVDMLKKLCPNADDVWLFWMMRLNGCFARRVSYVRTLYNWPGTQQTALFHVNMTGGGNDKQIEAMIKQYGFSIKD